MNSTLKYHLSDMPEDLKKAYLTYLSTRETDLNESLKDQMKVILTTELDESVCSMSMNLLTEHIDEPDIRALLEQIYSALPNESLTRQIIQSLGIVALFDDFDNVRTWGNRIIRLHDSIDPDNPDQLEPFLAKNMENEHLSIHLRWHSALGLAYMGTRPAIEHLIAFANILALKIPVVTRQVPAPFDEDANRFLAEKTGYAIGLSASKISEYGHTDNAIRTLKRLKERLVEPDETNHPILWAIEEVTPRKQKPATRFKPFRIALAACLACIFAIYGAYDFFRNPEIENFGIFKLAASNNIRSEIKPIPATEILHSGDTFTVRFQIDKSAHAYVWLYNSSGDIVQLFSGEVSAHTQQVVPNPKDALLTVPEGSGNATVYWIISKTPIIRNIDDNMAELKQLARHRPITADDIRHLVPNIRVESQSFRYE